MISGLNRIVSGACAVILGGTILLTSAAPALAGHNGQENGGFREFRLQNAGMDRHSARRMFIANRRSDRVEKTIQPIGTTRVQNLTSARELRVENRLARIDMFNGNRQQSLQVNQNGGVVRLNSGINLDLTSGDQNIVLGKNLFSDSVSSIQINVGGETKTLTAGSHVTAAEYVAAKQMLTGQSQSLVINRTGAASGGNIDLGALTQDNDVMRASNLVVSSNVTTSGDFGKHSDFRLKGDLINFGTVNAFSSDQNIQRGTLHAEDINNHAGAVINSTVDLTLDASGNLNNAGTISSSQNLTLTAGGSINSSGTISASKDVNLQSSMINNHGQIQSTSGNLNVDGSSTAALSVNNSKGTLSALNGAINLRNTAYSGTSDTTIVGGDLLSRELNINSGTGLASVDVNKLTGTVNGTGTAAHVSASTDNLNIGSVCLTGDPTFFNQGDITIDNPLSVGENLVIVASGNITVLNGVTIQATTGTQGFDITMIAGAAFTSGGTNSPNLPTLNPSAGVTLSGKSSKTGGGINFGSGTLVSSQSDLVGNDSAGDIRLIAFDGKGPIAGQIFAQGATLKTGGSGTGNNGDIIIIAGAKDASGVVQTGKFDTTGGSGTGGVINIFTATPVAAFRNQPIVYDSNGNLVNGTIIASKTNKNADIQVSDIGGLDINASGDMKLIGGKIAVAGQMFAQNTNILLQASSTITGGAQAIVQAKTVDLEASGDIGTSGQKLNIATPTVTINNDSTSKGVNVYLNGQGTAGSVTTVNATNAQGQLTIDAPTLGIALNSTDLASYDLNTFRFGGTINTTKSINLFKLATTDPTADLTGFRLANVKSLVFNVAGNFGLGSGNENVFTKVGSIDVTAGKSINSFVDGKKAVITAKSVDGMSIGTTGGIVKSATSTGGFVSIAANSGTLTIDGDITAATLAQVGNVGQKSSDKIAFKVNSTMTGSTVDITVFDPTVVVAPPSANVQISGAVTVTGSGIKAKAPTNFLNSSGAGHEITVNNGKKAGNLSFAGGVVITAQ